MVNIKKLESTQKLLIETREKILSDRESWNDYVLNAAVKFYKYGYADQLLIHAQRRDATACAEYHIWNDIFKRYVKRNSKGIALLENIPDGSQRLRYVFDVSDTGGKDKAPELWAYKDDYENIVKTALCEAFNRDNGYPLLGMISSIASSEAFSWLSDQNYLGPNTLRHLIERNAEVVVLERLGLRGTWMPEYNGVETLDYDEAELLFNGINHVAGRILRTIERTIKLQERSLDYGQVVRGGHGRGRSDARRTGGYVVGNNENRSARGREHERGTSRVQGGERDTISSSGRLLHPGSSGGRSDTGEDRTLRESQVEVPSGEPTGGREPDDTRREYKRDSGTAERGSGEPDTRTLDGIGKEESRPGQDEASAGMGGSHEYAQGAGDRDSDERDDLRLESTPGGGFPPASIPKKRRRRDNSQQLSLFPSEEEQRSAIEAQNQENTSNSKPIITDEFIDDLLRVGPMRAGGKERILNFFSAHLDAPVEEKERFLSGLYAGSSFDIDTADEEAALGDAKFNENGIEVFLRYIDIPDRERFISWNDAAQRIEKIIREGNYLVKNGPEEIWNGAEIKVAEEDIDRMAAAGTGFAGGRRRIADIFASHNFEITDDLVNLLRDEYRDTTRQSVRLTPDGGRETLHSATFLKSGIGYYKTLMRIGDLREKRSNMGCHVSISWREMAERIGRLLREGKYLTEADKAMSEDEVAAGNKISREDIESVFLSQPFETRMQNYKILLDEEKYGLKKETGKTIEYSGYSYDFPDGFDGMVTFESGKRRIQKGNIEVVLSKAKAKAVIKQLIRDGRYLSPEEMQEIEDREEANQLGELEFTEPDKEEVENSAQTDAETSLFEADAVPEFNSNNTVINDYPLMGAALRDRTDKEIEAFSRQLDRFSARELSPRQELIVMETPQSLLISDSKAKKLDIVLPQHVLRKIIDKHHISINAIKQLPEALANPVMVLESEGRSGQIKDGFVVMIEMRDDRGATINVPIALNSVRGRNSAQNVITSMYGRADLRTGEPIDQWFLEQASKDGLLRYINTKKISRWFDESGLALPGRGYNNESLYKILALADKKVNADTAVKNEDDLAKAWMQYEAEAAAKTYGKKAYEHSVPVAAKANYRITDDCLGVGTPKERYANNIAAIKLLKELETSGRMASAEEQDVLAKYVGWGGLAGAFDEDDSGWSREYLELKELLTDEEYRSARASTLTAYYTPPIVTQAIYSTLERMGFAGGNVLEPAMGTGHFFGTMPEEIRNNSRLYGVELDSLTGRIAAQLYQRADIKVCGYEATNYQDNFFDAAVGNVPFGQYKVADARYNKLNYSIHDYYFAKTLDKVRPGGVVAFVTSRYTMDKENSSVRRYIAQRAELLGAVRLPNTAFKSAAGTEVVSDILFLQKRERVMDVEPEWIYTGKTDDGIAVNEYFVRHPEMVCGKLELASSAYGPTPTCSPIEGKDLGDMLSEAMSHIEGRFAPVSITLDEDEKEPLETIPADPTVRNYSYTVVDGEVYYRENAVMYKPEKAVGTRAERIKGLVALRDCTRELIDYQLNGYSDEDIAAKQRELRQLYDGYTAKYGIINSRGNAQAFEADSGYFLLCSLEELDAEGNLKGLADMFSVRTIGYKAVPERVDTAVEALAVSISESAGVDLPYMSSLLGGKAEDEIVKELDGVIYENPLETTKNGGKAVYETADAYLSGDILQKIHIAEIAEKGSPGKYQKNIEALQKVMPERLSASEITVRLGTSWIEPRFIKDFIVELLEPTSYFANNTLDITYIQMNAEWRIQGKRSDKFNTKATETYGTAYASAYDLIEEALNGKTPKIYKTVIGPDGNERRELDAKETAAAVQKQEIIKDKFKDWIFRDLERREYLVDKYNRLFNNIRPREYDGSHISFSGMNPEMKLEKHQRDAAARILYGPNTLLAHVVGAGKTFEMVSSAMESKRLGLCHKSMFVVPNHLTEQTAAEFLKLYPAANILVATRKDFEAKNRKTICSRIATGDYDAVILGYTQFEKIPMSYERQAAFLQEQIDQVMAGIDELKRSQGERFSVKRYEQQQIKLQEKMEILQQRMNDRKDDVITFEELGVDRLYIDEAHNYKNLMTYTKMSNVAGISTTEAQKSADLYMKCRYMDEITGGKGIVFATGTPVSNSMVELYTMQRYLQMSELEKRGLTHFDSWASSFGETTNVLELAPEGSGYRMRTRFAKFYNLPELMRMLSECADIKTADMLNLPVPTAHYETVAVKPSEKQLEMIQELSKRAEKVRNRIVRPDEDNMLAITNDGRKIGLDQRLMDDSLPDDPLSKVNACVSNVLRIWNETKEEHGTQLIFCDFSTPGKGFNLYDDIKEKLIRAGVPSEEIAFIHDADNEAKKAALFARVRVGRVRVLMGSTQKMGAGTNVQDRLVASHDLDCPWRPADLEQRAGRIVRQGNRNSDVYIYRYVTEQTFDAYLYQTVENKQKFISQIMTSRSPLRSCEDMDESVLQYAEIKALCSGNPKIKEKMDLDVQVGRLTLLKAAYNDNRYRLEQSVAKSLPERIAFLKGLVKGLEDDIAHIEEHTHEDNEAHFSPMKIMQTLCTEKKSAGAKILMAREMKNLNAYTPIGEYRGMPMYIGSVGYLGGAQTDVLRFQREGGPKTEVELGDDALGNIARINNAFAKLPDRLELAKTQLAQCEKQLADYAEELRKPFEHAEELDKLQARLNVLNAELSLDGPQMKQEAEQEQERQEDIQDNLKDRLSLEPEGVSGDIEPDLPFQDKPEKIEDFGEKIGGARKDLYAYKREIEASNALTDDEIADKPLSEVFPIPRYDKLLKDGTAPEAVAMIRAIRDSLPEKPKKAESYKKAVYAQSIKAAKGLVSRILDDDGFALSLVHEHSGDEFLDKVIKKAELYLALGHDVSLADCTIRRGTFTVVRGEKLPNPERLWVIESKKLRTIGYGELYDDAVDDFKNEMTNREKNRQDKSKNETKFDIYFYKNNREAIFVGKKVGRDYVKLAGPFENGKEAGRYIREHRDELEARWQAYKSIPYERRSVNDPRAGKDWRNGKNVTPEMFMEAFGFRGVEFGNYVEQDKRQLDLNEAYDALMDLADAINVPPKALSLNGQLGLAFGARGKGGKNAPKAHYEPFYTAINLTKSQGAGSLAHEWMHAVDNFFGDKHGKSTMMSDSGATMGAALGIEEMRQLLGDVRPEMADAFGGVFNAVRRETELEKRSKLLDKRRSGKPYWATMPELQARAFESYVVEKLAERGVKNDYLANITSEELWKERSAERGPDLPNDYPYPTKEEMPVVREAFDKFFEAVKTRETEKGIEMYSLGQKSRGRALPPVSIDDVKAHVKGAEIIDRGQGKLTLKFANGTQWVVDTMADRIPVDPDVVARDYGREVSPEDVVSGRTRIFDGQSFIDLVAGMSDAATFSHECFEATWEMLNADEQTTLLNAYKTREMAADRYAAFLEGRVSSSSSAVGAVFQRVKDFFMDIRASLFGRNSEDIFRQIAQGKVYKRPVRDQENSERYAVNAEIVGKGDELTKRMEVDEIIDKPVPEWTNEDAGKVLDAIDAGIADDRARDHKLCVDLNNAAPGEKGKVIEAYERESETMKGDTEQVRKYLSKLQEWQDFKDCQDTRRHDTFVVDREKGVYSGKILSISEDGSTITQQIGKGIVELDHKAEDFPKEKLAGLRPGQRVTICYHNGRANFRVREENELGR